MSQNFHKEPGTIGTGKAFAAVGAETALPGESDPEAILAATIRATEKAKRAARQAQRAAKKAIKARKKVEKALSKLATEGSGAERSKTQTEYVKKAAKKAQRKRKAAKKARRKHRTDKQ